MAVLIDAVVFSEDVVRHEITNGAKGKIDVTVAPKIISTQVICIYQPKERAAITEFIAFRNSHFSV